MKIIFYCLGRENFIENYMIETKKTTVFIVVVIILQVFFKKVGQTLLLKLLIKQVSSAEFKVVQKTAYCLKNVRSVDPTN